MRSGVLAAILLAGAMILSQAPASAQQAPEALRNGQWAWYEQPQLIKASAGDEGPVSIVVSIPDQRAYVYRGGTLLGASTVSTGSNGHETPTGSFTILQKKEFHRSNLYSNAPMPYMQRLTWSGIALHAGHLPGYPASHGCIRFPAAFAKELYALTALGGDVLVTAARVVTPKRAVPLPPLLTADARNLGDDARVTASFIPAPAPVPAPERSAPAAPVLVADARDPGGDVRVTEAPIVQRERPVPAAPVRVADAGNAAGDVRMAEVAAVRRERPARSAAAPVLMADARDLGGAAFDMVTMSGDAPDAQFQPANWVIGPAREIVQPVRSRRGSK